MNEISLDALRERLSYNSVTGELFWNMRVGPAAGPGDLAGKAGGGNRYKKVQIKGRSFLAHRVCWALFYNEWPRDQIDHINGDKLDNRISNLRCVSRSENMRNLLKHREGKKFGVHFIRGKWHSSIRMNSQTIFIGSFKTQDEAASAVFGFLKGVKSRLGG